MVLSIEGLSRSFDGVQALQDVCLTADAGKLTAVIGPNGAGKTTLFAIVSGFLKADAGEVKFGNTKLLGLKPHQVARCGVGRLFQDVRVFGRLTAMENVMVGFRAQHGENPLWVLSTPRRVAREEAVNRSEAERLLDFVGLGTKARSFAEDLSYGEQKLVAIARLLANGSQLMLLDEPMAGVNPQLAAQIIEVLKRLADEGKTVLIIEHNLGLVLDHCHWVYLLAEGQVAAFGTPKEVLNDKTLQEAYLGG